MKKKAALGLTLVSLVAPALIGLSAPAATAEEAAPAHARPQASVVMTTCGHAVVYGVADSVGGVSQKDDYWF